MTAYPLLDAVLWGLLYAVFVALNYWVVVTPTVAERLVRWGLGL